MESVCWQGSLDTYLEFVNRIRLRVVPVHRISTEPHFFASVSLMLDVSPFVLIEIVEPVERLHVLIPVFRLEVIVRPAPYKYALW